MFSLEIIGVNPGDWGGRDPIDLGINININIGSWEVVGSP